MLDNVPCDFTKRDLFDIALLEDMDISELKKHIHTCDEVVKEYLNYREELYTHLLEKINLQ